MAADTEVDFKVSFVDVATNNPNPFVINEGARDPGPADGCPWFPKMPGLPQPGPGEPNNLVGQHWSDNGVWRS